MTTTVVVPPRGMLSPGRFRVAILSAIVPLSISYSRCYRRPTARPATGVEFRSISTSSIVLVAIHTFALIGWDICVDVISCSNDRWPSPWCSITISISIPISVPVPVCSTVEICFTISIAVDWWRRAWGETVRSPTPGWHSLAGCWTVPRRCGRISTTVHAVASTISIIVKPCVRSTGSLLRATSDRASLRSRRQSGLSIVELAAVILVTLLHDG